MVTLLEKTIKSGGFYQGNLNRIPERIYNVTGPFNVFKSEPCVGKRSMQAYYNPRDYYSIIMHSGNSKIHYAGKSIEIQKQHLVFSSPQIPYKWENSSGSRTGYSCIFSQSFFNNYGNPDHYEVFQPEGGHVFELSDDQVSKVTWLYERMLEETNSDTKHNYEVLRILVSEMVHLTLEMRLSENIDRKQPNSYWRISSLFTELLERQFPLDETHKRMILRSVSEFADHLGVPEFYLIKSIEVTTRKTPKQIINERILQEARVLLKTSNWSLSEIALALGFTNEAHFNNFVKKHLKQIPLGFRVA